QPARADRAAARILARGARRRVRAPRRAPLGEPHRAHLPPAGRGAPARPPVRARCDPPSPQRAEPLPRATRLLLLAAAAEPLGDPHLLWRAAEGLGIGDGAGPPAEAGGLAELGRPAPLP